eukprot:17049_3
MGAITRIKNKKRYLTPCCRGMWTSTRILCGLSLEGVICRYPRECGETANLQTAWLHQLRRQSRQLLRQQESQKTQNQCGNAWRSCGRRRGPSCTTFLPFNHKMAAA